MHKNVHNALHEWLVIDESTWNHNSNSWTLEGFEISVEVQNCESI